MEEILSLSPDILVGDYNSACDYYSNGGSGGDYKGLGFWIGATTKDLQNPEHPEHNNNISVIAKENVKDYFVGPHELLTTAHYIMDPTNVSQKVTDMLGANKVDWTYVNSNNNLSVEETISSDLIGIPTMTFYEAYFSPGSQENIAKVLHLFENDKMNLFNKMISLDRQILEPILEEIWNGLGYNQNGFKLNKEDTISENDLITYNRSKETFIIQLVPGLYIISPEIFKNPAGGTPNLNLAPGGKDIGKDTYEFFNILFTYPEVQQYLQERLNINITKLMSSIKKETPDSPGKYTGVGDIWRELMSYINATDHRVKIDTIKQNETELFKVASFNIQFFLLNIDIVEQILEELKKKVLNIYVVKSLGI